MKGERWKVPSGWNDHDAGDGVGRKGAWEGENWGPSAYKACALTLGHSPWAAFSYPAGRERPFLFALSTHFASELTISLLIPFQWTSFQQTAAKVGRVRMIYPGQRGL